MRPVGRHRRFGLDRVLHATLSSTQSTKINRRLGFGPHQKPANWASWASQPPPMKKHPRLLFKPLLKKKPFPPNKYYTGLAVVGSNTIRFPGSGQMFRKWPPCAWQKRGFMILSGKGMKPIPLPLMMMIGSALLSPREIVTWQLTSIGLGPLRTSHSPRDNFS